MRDHRTIDDVLNPRAAKARQQFEVPVMVAALAVLPIVVAEQIAVGGWETLLRSSIGLSGQRSLWNSRW